MNTEHHSSIRGEKLYSLDIIEKMCRGNREKIVKMIRVFTETVPPAISEIKAASKQRDFSTIRKTAHRIKPTLAIYAITELEKEITQMEMPDNYLSGTIDLDSIVEKLDTIITHVVTELKTKYLIN